MELATLIAIVALLGLMFAAFATVVQLHLRRLDRKLASTVGWLTFGSLSLVLLQSAWKRIYGACLSKRSISCLSSAAATHDGGTILKVHTLAALRMRSGHA